MSSPTFKVGDVLQRTGSTSLATKVRVTEVTDDHFKAQVLEGENTRDPITVFRDGWFLYAKTSNDQAHTPREDEL